MKNFLKMMLAVICGIFLLNALVFSVIAGIASAGSGTPSVPSEGVLKIDLSKIVIGEQSKEADPLEMLQSGSRSVRTIGLWDAVQAINTAADDPGIKYIYLKTDGSATSAATAGELRESLSKFRQDGGKAIISYIEAPTTLSYYLASVADKVYMTPHPGATSSVTGVSSQMIFLGDLLKKLGVNVQLIRHGKYKSAGEMFTRSNSSPENREQYQLMVNSMWKTLSTQIAESRGISIVQLNEAVDGLKLCLPQDFVDCGLVDGLLDREALQNQLAVFAVEDSFSDVTMIDFGSYVDSKVLPSKGSKKIAVIYANGEIIDGGENSDVGGDRFASIIEKVAKDKSVKAVVLRVNSPGGSVLASEKIKAELDRLKEEKPLVASYGDYAASGGYWISNNCEKIFSDALTLTGSIGVFGMIPDFSKTASDVLKVGVETISSNKHSDMMSLMRPFDKEEYDFMLRSIEDIYDRFTTIVSQGRGIPKEQVDAIGQGHVWTGADALDIKLVDEIGTLEDALMYAANLAGDSDLENWNVKGYPATKSQLETLIESLGGGNGEDFSIRLRKTLEKPRIVARLPYNFSILQ
ncbi:MAG: signal peptide peptidase SppA [Bacteroidales bacterium]|nr:signal peptide peptidase SppA [Bacteroidales bacterium]